MCKKILNTRKVAFFDVDTQFDFMSPRGKLFVRDAPKIVNNLRRLTNFARKNNIIIFSSVDRHIKDDPEFKAFPSHCVKNTKGQKKISGTKLEKVAFIDMKEIKKDKIDFLLDKFKQIIIEKNTYTVFANPNTKKLIAGFQTFYVYGVALDYCVRVCCLGLCKYKKSVFLIVDAVKEVNLDSGLRILNELKQKGVKFIKTNRVISI